MRLTNFDIHNNYYVPQKNFVLNVTIDEYCYGNVVDKLGQYEDIEENPEKLAKIKEALELVKVLFQGRARLYERNDGIEQVIDKDGYYHKAKCTLYILEFHNYSLYYEFHLRKDEFDLLKEVLL